MQRKTKEVGLTMYLMNKRLTIIAKVSLLMLCMIQEVIMYNIQHYLSSIRLAQTHAG